MREPGMPADRSGISPIRSPPASQSTSRAGSSRERRRNASAKARARSPATGSAPAAKACSTTPSVPFNPTRPPMPAIGLTTKPMRRNGHKTGPEVFRPSAVRLALRRSLLLGGPAPPGPRQFGGGRDNRQVDEVADRRERDHRPQGRRKGDRRRETRRDSELDDLEFAPGHRFQIRGTNSKVDPHGGRGEQRAEDELPAHREREGSEQDGTDRGHRGGVPLRITEAQGHDARPLL